MVKTVTVDYVCEGGSLFVLGLCVVVLVLGSVFVCVFNQHCGILN